MKRVLRNRYNPFLTLCIGLMAIFALSGCPKKVSPLGKTQAPPQSADNRRLPPGTVPKDENIQGGDEAGIGQKTSLGEEEIPPSAPPEDVASLPSSTAAGQTEGSLGLADIFFDFGQWNIRSADTPLLDQNTVWLAAHSDKKIYIEGHADKRGTNEYNLVLAEKRAGAVQEYLIQRGIPSTRMVVVSYGEERPFCSAEEEVCFQENRRAHFNVE